MSSYFNGLLRKITAGSASATPISGLVLDPENPERGEYKGRPVSIFCPASALQVKRLKTLKHPNILQYIADSSDTAGTTSVWLLTEPAAPLDTRAVTEHKDWAALVAWQAASAVLFLNKQAGIAHCNLHNSTASMLMDDTGMFKLGGLEGSLSRREAEDRERLARIVGCQSVTDEQLATIDQPKLIAYIQNNLQLGHFTSLEQFVADFESHRLVQLVSRLDSLHIDVDLDRMATVKAAAVFTHSPSCPKPLVFKVLLMVFGVFQNTEMSMDTVRVLLECLDRLLGGAGGVYQKRCLEVYGCLLATQKDRNVKLLLVEGVERVVGKVGGPFCDSTIYPFLTASLTDTCNATIRDASLRTLIAMATQGHLLPSLVSGDLLRHLARLQDDPQPGIRANLLIGMAKLDPILPKDISSKVIGPAYCRGLTDPFGPSKIAALSGLIESGRSCSRHEMAVRLLPCICPLLVDENVEIAGRAVVVVDLFMDAIKEHTKPWASPVVSVAKPSSLTQAHPVSATSQCEQLMKEMSIQPQPTQPLEPTKLTLQEATPAGPAKPSIPGRGRLGATRKLQ